MPCTLPRHKTSAARGIRFNPYTQPYTSSNESIAPITAHITRTYALYIDKVALNTALERMGSAMLIDEPYALDGTMGSQQDVPIQNIDLANDEFSKMRSTLLVVNFTAPGANHVSPYMGRLSPNQRKLVRSLEKVVNRCIDCNCEGDHPTTDLLRESIYAALEGAVLGIEVDDVMHSMKAENSKTNDNGHIRQSFGVPVISNNEIHQKLPTNNVIPPAARYIFDGMKHGLFSLGTVLSALHSEQFQNHRK
ncbi:hypothetical protein DFH29DRAFT_880244 [Suillus ampliporus]|nr:hypothetical protein DFH29DRAFT_880244 [Suillus ampliporus]